MNCASCSEALPPGARFCPGCGTPCAVAADFGERKLVTVVFCDLVGSTELAEALDPETLRSATLRYFSAMREPIKRFGGTVEKFIGDAVMAVFGVPTIHEDDARRAALAALGMIAALEELNVGLDAELGVRLRVRIGVNTGPAVTGAGFAARQALVSGETVNIAARLEQAAGTGEILIGPLTRESLGETASVAQVGPLQLKGKREPVTAYRLLALAERPSAAHGAEPAFVGRDAEFAVLSAALDAAARDRGTRLLSVHGEPGIGKSRLLRTWLERVPGVASGVGQCRPYGERGSLAPLAEAVRQVLDAGGAARVRGAEFMSVLEAGPLRDGSPGPAPEATALALGELLEALAAEHPVVLVLDDFQWAQEPLIELLNGRLGEGRAAVLIVCAARLEVLDRGPGAIRAQSLTVPALSQAECAQLLRHGQGRAGAPRDPAALYEASGGNPLHLDLLAAAESEISDDLMPYSLQALLGARIDALSVVQRAVLDQASVLGREFSPPDVRALLDWDQDPDSGSDSDSDSGSGSADLRQALAGLRVRRLVEPADPGGAEDGVHRFTSGLVHEATYQAMAKRTRADRHEKAADLLAAAPDAGTLAAAAAIANHLERAYLYRAELGNPGPAASALRLRAAQALGSAGTRALARCDLAWSRTLLRRAVDLFAVAEPGWDVAARALGEVEVAVGATEDGAALLRSVIDATADPVQSAHARLALAVAEPGATPEAVADIGRRVLPVFGAAGDRLGRARARIRIAQEHQLHGRHARAVDLLRRALGDAVAVGAEPEQARALGAVGVSLWRGPMPVPRALDRCRGLLIRYGGPRPAVRLTLGCPLAVLHALNGQSEIAHAEIDRARQLAEKLGFAEGAIVLPVFEAAVASLCGRPEHALDLLDQAADAARRLGARGQVAMIDRSAARLLLDLDRVAEAEERLAGTDVGIGILRSDEADVEGLRARAAAARGEAESALGSIRAARAAAALTDSPLVRAAAAHDEAAVRLLLGDLDAARAAALEALTRYRRKRHLPGVRSAELLLADLGSRPRPVPVGPTGKD